MTGPEFGLVLCSQFPPGTDATARFAEQVEQVHHVRDAGFSSVWATQHYLAEEFQYLHPLAVLLPGSSPRRATCGSARRSR